MKMVPETQALKQMIALAVFAPPVDVTPYARQIEQTENAIKEISGTINGLLGVEKGAQNSLEYRKRKLENQLDALDEKRDRLERCAVLGKKYKRVSMNPLGWRHANGFPKLAIFTLHDSEFIIGVDAAPDRTVVKGVYSPYSLSSFFLPDLPDRIKGYYTDVIVRLKEEVEKEVEKVPNARKRNTQIQMRLVCQFEGLIPPEIKQKIKEAESLFCGRFEGIFIIAEIEPEQWRLNRTITPMRDPLVVGYDPKADENVFWLISAFDTTPVEDAMMLELSNYKL